MVNKQYQKQTRAVALLSMACMISAAGCTSDTEEEARQARYRRGENIFLGNELLPARIAGHQDFLPPPVARCVNCHVPGRRVPVDTESAPSLSGQSLLQTRARRGGPAFAYGRESFCSTLRTGIDPEYVTLKRAMPRFNMDTEQCQALWEYLTEKHSDETQ
ncbi:hypothetical protein [Noviherbaspirillum sedimenti]|uniref:hypothetical protein n=1 Tax=Noviherbaspirillum sedimenti TaxID=2320865 RepID=UPI0018F2DBFB|nr:hypothetical protein [Noviherbaspirillum sedimenti]